MVYRFKQGSRIGKADANIVVDELSVLGNNITPEGVVKIAQNEETELHKCFEWDDSTAAEKYRISQARHIVSAIIICPDADDILQQNPVVISRAYENVTVTEDGNRAYVPIVTIMGNDDMLEEVFTDIRNSIDELTEKIDSYEALSRSPAGKRKANNVKQRLKAAKEAVA